MKYIMDNRTDSLRKECKEMTTDLLRAMYEKEFEIDDALRGEITLSVHKRDKIENIKRKIANFKNTSSTCVYTDKTHSNFVDEFYVILESIKKLKA